MANHLFTGIKVTGSLAAGTALFEGVTTYLWYTPDFYEVIFYDSGDRIGGDLITNEFGMPDKRLSFPLPFVQILGDGGSFDQRFAFDLTFSSGDVTQILQLYNSATDTSYLFALDGTALELPGNQADLTAWLTDIDTATAFTNPNQPFNLRGFDHITTKDRDVYTVTAEDPLSIDFGAGNDVIFADAAFGNYGGGAGNDRLIALAGSDGVTLLGGDGDDYIKFRDFVSGNASGEGGDDRIIGNDNIQTIYGGAGSDVLFGLAGIDTIQADEGDDFVYGGRDTDILNGGDGNDVLRGNRGDDLLYGDAGNPADGTDRLYGGGGNDELYGGGARDFLIGENGNDRLDGGADDDNLTGGAGADEFVYQWYDFDPYSHGYDRILDFEDGIDVINLIGTITDFADVSAIASETGGGLRLRFDAGDVLFLDGMTLAQFDASDVVFNA